MAKGRLNRWIELALTARLAVSGRGSAKAAAAVAERCVFLPATGEGEAPAAYNALKSLVHAWSAAADDQVRAHLVAAVTATLNAIDAFPNDHFPELIRLQRKGDERRGKPQHDGGRRPWWIDN